MGVVRANTGFIRSYGGQDVMIEQGDILDELHEIVLTTPDDWWDRLEPRLTPVVEEATAKPGKPRATAKKVEPES